MAENLRAEGTSQRDLIVRRVAEEARRQEESCLYTSTTLYHWLRRVRLQKQLFVGTPVVLGAIAGVSVLQQLLAPWIIAVLALGASMFPALADALNIQTSVDEIAKAAAEFKALQDRFRRLATITAISEPDRAEAVLAELMDRMDVARSNSITPPERYFLQAKAKIDGGHYEFAIDANTTAGIDPRRGG